MGQKITESILFFYFCHKLINSNLIIKGRFFYFTSHVCTPEEPLYLFFFFEHIFFRF